MNNILFNRTNIWPLAILVVAMLPATGFAQSGDPVSAHQDFAHQINQANALVRDGRLEEAIAEYQQIQPEGRQRSELDYNLAVAQFRKGDIESAQNLFHTAASSDDAAIASASRYNLGNCLYSKALTIAEQDKSAAIEQLRQAISHYRGSLRVNPDNADARANIELAAELIRNLEEEQKQKEQQQQDQENQQQDQEDQQDQDQDQDQEDQQNQDEDQDEDQEQKQEQSGEGQDEQSADEQPQNEQKNGEKQNDQQADEPKSGDELSESNDNQDGQSKESKSESKQPQDAQSKSEDQQSSEDTVDEKDGKNQSVPTGQLTAAGEQDESGKPNGSVAMADPNATEGMMTKEEALKMLQAVRDRDMLRRLQQERLERSRHVPVDRDW